VRISGIKSGNEFHRFGFFERLAATYSRGIYKTTTIGKTAFDGRVRNGNGSDRDWAGVGGKSWRGCFRLAAERQRAARLRLTEK
jgi:hypothetical protein